MALPVLARCKKCGRGFVSLPAGSGPWQDRYVSALENPPLRAYPLGPEWVCGGEIVIVDHGRPQMREIVRR